MVDVTVNIEIEGTCGVKLQDHKWELNIHAAPADLRKLAGIRDAKWAEGRSLGIGTCAGAPVWWCAQDDSVAILAGDDDQVWEAAVPVPLSTVHEFLRLTEDGRTRHSAVRL